MRITILTLVAVLSAAIAQTGCFTVDRADARDLQGTTLIGTQGKPDSHVVAGNFGYYLFNLIPIVSGNSNTRSWLPWTFFRDDVTLASVQSALVAEADARHCQMANVHTFYNSTCMFSFIPYIQNSLGIVWYREVQLSAILVKSPVSTPTTRAVDPLAKKIDLIESVPTEIKTTASEDVR